MADNYIFYQYIVASLVIVVAVVIDDVFPQKLHKFNDIKKLSSYTNINFIVVIDLYSLFYE